MSSRSCRVMMFDKLRFFLDPSEYSFLSKILYLKDLRECGCRTAYSQDFNFKSFNLSRDIFYRCAKRLEYLGLLKRVSVGKFTDYLLSENNYYRLLEIVNSTENIYALIAFNENHFLHLKKSIEDITDSDIRELKDSDCSL